MKIPRIFLSKKDPRYWHEYWKNNRVLPPRDPYLYYGRITSMQKVDRYFNKITRQVAIEEKLEKFKNFIENIFKK